MKKSRLLAVMTIGVSLVAGGLAAAPAVVHAQNVGSGQTGGSVAFVRDSANAGQFEVQSAGVALARSQNVGVRGYATAVLKDGNETLNRVKFINQNNVGTPMPSGVNDQQQAELNRLAGLSGADFDREYMRSQVAVSEFLANTFRAYGANGESDTLRVYVAKAVTDYEKQTQLARQTAGSL